MTGDVDHLTAGDDRDRTVASPELAPPPRPLALWATPRTGSTAFERMMMERGDHRVLTEPFSVAYYFGPDRSSNRFTEQLPASSYEEVLARIGTAAAEERPVFLKDMAYHLGPRLGASLLRGFRNSFLVRDPAWALPSLARRWPDFTDDEAGYEAQRRAFRLVARITGVTPVVIDSDDLRRDPAGIVAAWCERVGLAFDRDALTWEPGMPAQWRLWADWFAGAAASRGFTAPPSGPPPRADRALAAAVRRCRPAYEELSAHRLAPRPEP